MKKIETILLVILVPLFLFIPGPSPSQDSTHPKIILKGFDGNPLSIDSKNPYSPKKTCGSCHNYDLLTSGYHFQHGRTNGEGKIMVRDDYDPKYPWNLSSGMYGKHLPSSFDSSQLAPKVNRGFSDIDKSSFFFVEHCGTCHPGGGPGEYDRRGNLYFNEETQKFGYEIFNDDPIYDGDYTSFSMGNLTFGSPWDKSGVSEADCLICHLKGYLWKERAATLKGRFFKFGPTVGAGWATVKPSQNDPKGLKAMEVTVDYTKKELADFENLPLKIIKRPPDENCWTCHATSDGRNRGRQWSPETDIHKAKDLSCVDCHPGNKEHNFAKGDTLQETVRDDFDHTMNSCEDCHYKGKHQKAPKYKHPFSPRHMKRIACQTCHIPYQAAPADLVYDHSSGSTLVYNTPKFLSNDPMNPKKSIPGAEAVWYPTLREWKGKIVPVKSLIAIYWGDLDEKNKRVKPIFLWKIRDLKKPPFKDDDRDGIPEINSLEEIKAFLKILKGKDKFGNPIAHYPVLVKAGFIYKLDKKGEVEKIRHEQAEPLDISLSHNVVSGSKVIGARGCKDCHSKKSSFFLRKVLTDPYDEKGRPLYIETWERLGIDKEKLDRLLTEP